MSSVISSRSLSARGSVERKDRFQPYAALRAGQIDLLCNWLAVDEADLATSAPIGHSNRALAVSRRHRLAGRASVSIEELARERVNRALADYPQALLPARTPSGRPILRNDRVTASTADSIAEISQGDRSTSRSNRRLGSAPTPT